MGDSVKILKTNMKLAVIGLTTFLVSISLAQDVVNEKAGNSIKVDTRAPSTYQNCNCQCDSYTWSDGNYIRGNCRSKAKLPGPSQATGLFCYISGSALCSCRDVQRSNSVVDSYGNFRDGDFPYCSNSGSNSGSNQGWSSGSSNSNQGWSSGSSNSNYRPGGSSSYRPGGSSSYRPGGSSSSYRPSGSSSYRPGNSPSLDNISNGSIRNGNTGDKNKDKDAVVFSDA